MCCCQGSGCLAGGGCFTIKDMAQNAVEDVGIIPPGKWDVYVRLEADAEIEPKQDIDIQLYVHTHTLPALTQPS